MYAPPMTKKKEYREFWVDKQSYTHNIKNNSAKDQCYWVWLAKEPKDKSGDYMFKAIETQALTDEKARSKKLLRKIKIYRKMPLSLRPENLLNEAIKEYENEI